ncbi:MAG: ABC transporter permease [Planctomycetaceae bacterium]
MTIVNAGAADWFDVEGAVPTPKEARRLKDGTIGLVVGLAMLAILLLMGILVPLLSPYTTDTSVDMPFVPPSSQFLFGTDGLGRDVFVRVFAAVYLDLGVALLGVLIPFVIGTIVGIGLAVSRSKTLNAVVGSIIDGINAFPLLVLAIALIALLGPGLQSVIIALSLTNWARYARLARTRAMVVKQQGYIEAAQTLGYSKPRILFKHLVPNVSSETTAYALSDLILVILLIASLSFLGLGAQPPTAEWGAMISDGRPTLQVAWWPVIFPGLALCWAGVSLSFIAEGLTRRERDVKS